MPRYDFKSPRLFVEPALSEGTVIELSRSQANYLLSALRKKSDETVLIFNGEDGEWLATIEVTGRKNANLSCTEQTRPQPKQPDLEYWFAPLKQARLDYMVQKAVEMGVGKVVPVLTEFTQVRKLNRDRLYTNAVEAAEQCGILSVPEISEPLPLDEALSGLGQNQPLLFCDEGEASQNPLEALATIVPAAPLVVLIGPEGGFSEAERTLLRALENTVPVPLGPRVLRADTAAVAALALVQASLGDWQN